MKRIFAALTSVILISSCAAEVKTQTPVPQGTINVKGLFDLTGATSDVGISYSKGVLNRIDHLNKNGGIKGYMLNIQSEDYGYDTAKAEAIYEKWKAEPGWKDIVAIFGWGTGDSLKLSPKVTVDKVPYISASYAEILADPAKSPYNFFAGADYSTSIRLALKYIKKNGGKKIGFAACSASYCTEPLPAGKEQAQTEGLAVASDALIELSYKDEAGKNLDDNQLREKIHSQMETYFKANPDVDWVWIGNTAKTAAMVVEAGAKFAPGVKFIANVYGFDENIDSRYCKDKMCRSRAFGIFPFAAYGDTVHADGMIDLIEVHNKYNKIDEYADIRYVQGYTSVLAFEKALDKLLTDKQSVNGPSLKSALETFTDVSTGGLTAPISYSAQSHKPNKQVSIYSLNDQGKLKFEDNLSL